MGVTDEQAQRILNEMVDVWGDSLPHPIHEPRRTEYYLKLFKYAHPDRLEKALKGTQDESQNTDR